MTLRSRLILSHGIIIALTLLVAPLALFAVHRFVGQVDAIAMENVRAIEATEKIRQQLGVEVGELLRRMAGATDARDDAAAGPLRGSIDEARPYFASAAERAAFRDFENRYAQLDRDLRNRAFDTKELPSHFSALVAAVAHLRALKTQALAGAAQDARDFAAQMFGLLIAFSFGALLIGFALMLREIRAITRPVDQLNSLIRRMGAGDFDIVYENGEIADFNALGRHFEAMGQALRAFRAINIERTIVEQRRNEAVLDSIGDGLVIFSEAGVIERINPVAERQLGIEHGSADGRSFGDVGPQAVARQVRELLERGEVGGSVQLEVQVDRGGDKRVLAYSLHRFVEGGSGAAGVVMVMRDVTIQREFDRMRSEFVLRASHELRTPIASIRMGLGLLGEKLELAPGSRDEELYDTVQQEVLRMVHLLTDLLDLSRLRVGDQAMERAPADVGAIVAAAEQRFAPAAQSGGIALRAEIEPGLPRLQLSRSGFDRVLDNLINNALRHTQPGGSITLRAALDQRHVVISVADTGEGIASNQLALVFQPFVQIGGKRGGAGLGLAICKEIVNQHGGEIMVASQPRQGTTFTIRLPA
jgi:NtrC-family two-component system sensor histidine kinase KinB